MLTALLDYAKPRTRLPYSPFRELGGIWMRPIGKKFLTEARALTDHSAPDPLWSIRLPSRLMTSENRKEHHDILPQPMERATRRAMESRLSSLRPPRL